MFNTDILREAATIQMLYENPMTKVGLCLLLSKKIVFSNVIYYITNFR